jgi:hypothetical protein
MKKLVVGMMVLCAAPVATTVAMETEQLSPAQTPNTSASQTPSPQNGEKKHSPRTSPRTAKVTRQGSWEKMYILLMDERRMQQTQ